VKGIKKLKAGFADPKMKDLIETLWREYYGLYVEKYNRDPEKWLLNQFSDEIDFGQAVGQDHLISGNRSIAIGQGLVTRSLLEIVLGAYNLIAEGQNPEEWNPVDLLFTLANGPDEDNRSNAIEVFKSGLIRLFNAILIGEYDHMDKNGNLVDPVSGMLQYTELAGLELYRGGKWNSVMTEQVSELLSGTVNSENRVFTTSKAYKSGTIVVFVNGIRESDFLEVDQTTIILDEAPSNVGFTDKIETIYTSLHT
jgi:hypothetical protein